MNICVQYLELHFCVLGSAREKGGVLGWGVVLKVRHRLPEFGKQQPVFATGHLFLDRSLLFQQLAHDLFGCRLGAARAGSRMLAAALGHHAGMRSRMQSPRLSP